MPQGTATITKPDPAQSTDKGDVENQSPPTAARNREPESASLLARLRTLKPIEEDFAPIAELPSDAG